MSIEKTLTEEDQEEDGTVTPRQPRPIGIDLLEVPEIPEFSKAKSGPKYVTTEMLNAVLEERLGDMKKAGKRPTNVSKENVKSSAGETGEKIRKSKTHAAGKSPPK